MPEIYPTTLQQNVDVDFTETQNPRYIETEVDAGPIKKRNVFTKPMPVINGKILLDRADYDTFKTFYETTLAGGIKTFYFNHPVTGVQKIYRFKDPPEYTAVGGINFRVSFVWEEM